MRVALSAATEHHQPGIRRAPRKSAGSVDSFALSSVVDVIPTFQSAGAQLMLGLCSKKQKRWKGIGHVQRKVRESKLVSKNPYRHPIASGIFEFSLRFNLPDIYVNLLRTNLPRESQQEEV